MNVRLLELLRGEDYGLQRHAGIRTEFAMQGLQYCFNDTIGINTTALANLVD